MTEKYKCVFCGSTYCKTILVKLTENKLYKGMYCKSCKITYEIEIPLYGKDSKPNRHIRDSCGKNVWLKRLVWGLHHSKKLKSTQDIYFKNGDTTDYRPANLIMSSPGNIPKELSVKCHQCGYVFIPRGKTKRCPECGSLKWRIEI